MIECSGRVLCGGEERVTGRLWRVGESSNCLADTAKILLWDGLSDITSTLNDTVVGVVLLGGALENVTLPKAEVPVFVPFEGEGSDTAFAGEKIAILDCGRKKLCIDPDIDVIKSFFDRFSSVDKKRVPVLCTDSERVGEGFDGVVVTADGDEDTVYERVCDIADTNTGAAIVAQISCGEGLYERIKGVMRAAVWGRVWLLCQVRTPEEAESLFEAVGAAVHELENEGREFNGFIPKGISIETPIMLLSEPPRGLDFYAVNCNKLLFGFTATENTDRSADRVFECILRYIGKSDIKKTALRAHGAVAAYAVEYFKGKTEIDRIYTDRETAIGKIQNIIN